MVEILWMGTANQIGPQERLLWMAVTLLQARSNVTKKNSMHECMSHRRK